MQTHFAFSAFVLLGISAVVIADLPSPGNVTLQTLNTNYILKWEWEHRPGSKDNVTFTAQYLAKYKINSRKHKNDWKTMCVATSEHHCDFTAAELYYLGMWILRVRAQSNLHVSPWIQVEFCPDRDVIADLPSPGNVTLQTLNTNYILKWEWEHRPGSKDNVTFTAQYLAKYKINSRKHKNDWKTMCVATSEHHCDFTAAELYYLGMWILRVRAQSNLHVSPWIQVEFCPDRDAAIGPPSAVVVKPVKGVLEVAISDPLSNRNTSMKEWVKSLKYIVQYWKDPLEMQKHKQLSTPRNLVTLSDLETWTWYCVRVQSRYDFYNKSSNFSPTYCEQTDGQMPYWQIFLYFLLSLALSFLIVLGLSFCFLKSFKVIKTTFYPSIQLPTPIQEYLGDSPGSEMPPLLTTESEVEICCDRLDILTTDTVDTDVVMEIHAPPQDSEQDGRNHSRHNSGDSGVYSTEEGSGSSQSSQALRGNEEVKLVKMGHISFHRERGPELDQRIQDACV